MSIVQEALKKAQGPTNGLGSEQNTNKKNFMPVVLLIVFIALLGFTIKQVAFSSGKSGATARSANTEAIYKPISTIDMNKDSSPTAETYTSPAKSKSAKGKFPDFVLNGIMELVDGPRAIVNNVIVSTGDVISGATVKKIEKDKVILQKKDSIVTLGME